LIWVIGEILMDEFPAYRRVGGAPFNFACHLKRMGLPVRFVSRVGKDETGRSILRFVEEHGFRPDDIQVDADHPSGTVQVTLDDSGVPDYIIHSQVAYDFLDLSEWISRLKSGAVPRMIYYGTLLQRTPQAFDRVKALLRSRNQGTAAFCDLNLRMHCYHRKSVLHSLHQADYLKLNEEELGIVADFTRTDGESFDPRNLLSRFAVKAVIVTRGKEGSEWISRDAHVSSKPPGNIEATDTVGAGDAHAAMSAYGILNEWTPERTIALADRLAARICQIQGALPDADIYSDLIR